MRNVVKMLNHRLTHRPGRAEFLYRGRGQHRGIESLRIGVIGQHEADDVLDKTIPSPVKAWMVGEKLQSRREHRLTGIFVDSRKAGDVDCLNHLTGSRLAPSSEVSPFGGDPCCSPISWSGGGSSLSAKVSIVSWISSTRSVSAWVSSTRCWCAFLASLIHDVSSLRIPVISFLNAFLIAFKSSVDF